MTLKSTGYLAEAQTVDFTGATQLMDSATDNEWIGMSVEIDNSVNKWTMADFILDLGSAAFGTATDARVLLYLVPSVDGTNYPDFVVNVTTEERENEVYYAGSFTPNADTEAQVALTARNVKLPVAKFKVAMRNAAGVSLAASGNTLKYRPHSYVDE